MKSVIATKKVNRITVYFFVALILGTLLGVFKPAYGQWQKYIIDDNINVAVSVDVADLDGDTKLDLIVTDWVNSKLIWYQNNFPQWIKHTIDSNAWGVTFAFSGDMDGNNTLDVVASLYTARKMVWYENNHPTWTRHIIDENTYNADFMQVADLDNDDTLDVVTPGGDSGGDIVWYENNHPNWTEHIIESGATGAPSLNVTDIDGDGLLDLVVTMVNANKVVWYKTEDNGLSWTNYTIDNSLNNAFGLNSGDIDGDGTMDIVATTGGPYFSGSDVVWYENNHPNWTKHIIDTTLDGATWPYVTDVDGDDTMDVIVGGFSGASVVWYENNHPTWTKHTIDANLDGPRVFAVVDVDGDEINDVIVPAIGSVVWYKNPYTTVAFGQLMEVYPKYIRPQQGDTLKLIAQISNPENHQVTVHALIQGENSTFQDSLQLFDDGLHNDSLASDNIFGGIKWLDELDEDYFDIKLRTTDSDESITTYSSEEHFTTIGPVVYDGMTFYSSDTIPNPGDYMLYKITLRNDGSTTEALFITAEQSTNDTCVSGLPNWNYFGDIPPGEVATNTGFYTMTISENCPVGRDIPIHISIASEGYFFWSDSFTVHVYELGIADEGFILPDVYVLHHNYPNPFNPITTIKYGLPKKSEVTLKIFNILGREVTTLVNEHQPAGYHLISWDASGHSSGIYFYQIQAGDFSQTRKLILLK
ncbi:T9SS type A sorting domain-containing protein [candidate division KSB1 bacterium]|nr:T9SS type A sorting domain-containing protein [candidate division KSB1 bacterium]